MNRRDAEELLADADVVPIFQLPLRDAKEVAEACLAADVPVALGRDDHCTTGCAPKLLVLAREEDVARIAAVIRTRWAELLDREGTLTPRVAGVGEGEALPCPACGSSVPDDAPECPDCGLVV